MATLAHKASDCGDRRSKLKLVATLLQLLLYVEEDNFNLSSCFSMGELELLGNSFILIEQNFKVVFMAFNIIKSRGMMEIVSVHEEGVMFKKLSACARYPCS